MKQPRGFGTVFIVTGLVMAFIFGSQLVGIVSQPADIWWTPLELAHDYGESRTRIEIYLNDTDLTEILDNGQLVLSTGELNDPVTRDDFKFRFNNYPDIMAMKIPWIIFDSIAGTLGLVMILIGIMMLSVRRPVDEFTENKSGEK